MTVQGYQPPQPKRRFAKDLVLTRPAGGALPSKRLVLRDLPPAIARNRQREGAEPRLTGVVQLGSTPLTLPRAALEL
jgi:hypothetical protein